jgi:hypothetical protein
MAELTVLDEKLAEVIGLAMAAQGATDKIVALTDDDELSEKLQQMHEEARETEDRGTQVADQLDGKKTAVLEGARDEGRGHRDDVDLSRRSEASIRTAHSPRLTGETHVRRTSQACRWGRSRRTRFGRPRNRWRSTPANSEGPPTARHPDRRRLVRPRDT